MYVVICKGVVCSMNDEQSDAIEFLRELPGSSLHCVESLDGLARLLADEQRAHDAEFLATLNMLESDEGPCCESLRREASPANHVSQFADAVKREAAGVGKAAKEAFAEVVAAVKKVCEEHDIPL